MFLYFALCCELALVRRSLRVIQTVGKGPWQCRDGVDHRDGAGSIHGVKSPCSRQLRSDSVLSVARGSTSGYWHGPTVLYGQSLLQGVTTTEHAGNGIDHLGHLVGLGLAGTARRAFEAARRIRGLVYTVLLVMIAWLLARAHSATAIVYLAWGGFADRDALADHTGTFADGWWGPMRRHACAVGRVGCARAHAAGCARPRSDTSWSERHLGRRPGRANKSALQTVSTASGRQKGSSDCHPSTSTT